MTARTATAPERKRVRIAVCGRVQGVGFRPFVWRMATELGLGGYVANTPDGLVVEAEGRADDVAALLRRLETAPPPQAMLRTLTTTAMATRDEASFRIAASTAAGAGLPTVSPDLATCADCLDEVFDPTDRRYRYPFTNCTNCGPRFSIVEAVPYDRSRTSMRRFDLCRRCRDEYGNPADRRFHAEPIACPACGPQLALWDRAGRVLATRDEALGAAVEALRDGCIVALKGLGGFHLLVDARADEAVRRLRHRKNRPAKPFALMVRSLAAAEALCVLSAEERALLTGPAAPIVLAARRPGAGIAEAVAPDSARLGLMLAYTPLHHLLQHDFGGALVATSGNRASESIVIAEAEVRQRLGAIADLFLVHDRPIVRPVEDSVVQIAMGKPMVLRCARGLAPVAIALSPPAPAMLAMGGQIKSAVAVSDGTTAIVGPHIGDLGAKATAVCYDRAAADLPRLHRIRPRWTVCDPHPDYDSTRHAYRGTAPVMTVQHHAAHIHACLAEHRLDPPVLGVAWDGTGYGEDGTVWGGEFLLVTETGWRRVASLRPFPLPGGDAAMREPRRSALGVLYALFGDALWARENLAPIRTVASPKRRVLAQMLRRGVNAPLCSSAGRLFDAAASLLDLRQRVSFEGEAATALEQLAAGRVELTAPTTPMAGDPLRVDWGPAMLEIVDGVAAGVPVPRLAARFHAALTEMIAGTVARQGHRRVVLVGGCFQNRVLLEATVRRLRTGGAEVFWPQKVPPNDGGLAFGQLACAARTLTREAR